MKSFYSWQARLYRAAHYCIAKCFRCLYMLAVCVLAGTQFACSYLQTMGVINDRAEDYQQARVYTNSLAKQHSQFGDSYPIPDAATTSGTNNSATSPDSLLRPKLGFIPRVTANTTRISHSLTSQQARSIHMGTTVAGDTALLLKDVARAEATQLLANQTLGLHQLAADRWRASGQPMVIEVTFFATSTMLVIVTAQVDEQPDAQDTDFRYKERQDPAAIAFAEGLQSKLAQLLN